MCCPTAPSHQYNCNLCATFMWLAPPLERCATPYFHPTKTLNWSWTWPVIMPLWSHDYPPSGPWKKPKERFLNFGFVVLIWYFKENKFHLILGNLGLIEHEFCVVLLIMCLWNLFSKSCQGILNSRWEPLETMWGMLW
jgi:hypothetical protein